jgi:hypothetical protein
MYWDLVLPVPCSTRESATSGLFFLWGRRNRHHLWGECRVLVYGRPSGLHGVPEFQQHCGRCRLAAKLYAPKLRLQSMTRWSGNADRIATKPPPRRGCAVLPVSSGV